ncbi:BnaCnng64240D [Brassica napus]|uniref:BnaCnng64240D protein n=1 Tax=Brassica napus TaxID=3708 RepID=A0A078JVJ9_BRANA|nr:BnaCnng64240D [Brassica napus]
MAVLLVALLSGVVSSLQRNDEGGVRGFLGPV